MRMRLFFRDEIESLLEQAGSLSVAGTAAPEANRQVYRSR